MKNYSAEELDDLLSTVAICKPLGSDDWQLVARWHLKKYPVKSGRGQN